MSRIDDLEKENDDLREEVLRLQLVEAQLRDMLKHAERIGGFSFNARLQGCERSEHTLQGVVRQSDSGGAPC